MANICETTYKVVGSRQAIKALYDKLHKMESADNPQHKSDWGNMWLGELVERLGYSWQKHCCRGEITYFELIDNEELLICQNTAWGEQNGVRECIERRYPTIKVYYQDIEPGCENFTTNDDTGQFFPEKFYFDDEKNGIQYFEDIDEACQYISPLVGKELHTQEDIESAVKQWQEEHDDSYMYFSEFQYAE